MDINQLTNVKVLGKFSFIADEIERTVIVFDDHSYIYEHELEEADFPSKFRLDGETIWIRHAIDEKEWSVSPDDDRDATDLQFVAHLKKFMSDHFFEQDVLQKD